MFKMSNLILYLHIFRGIGSLKGKEIVVSPQTNPGFASSLSDISWRRQVWKGNE